MADAGDESGLIGASRAGDPAAFEPLVRRYQRMIYSLVYRMTGSPEDAEDLTQEVFIRAFRELPRYRAEARFATWLYQIAVNHCLNARKRAARTARLLSDWATEQDLRAAGGETGGVDLPSSVQEALLALDERQRAAVILTVYDGLNHAEAARVLKCSEATISWRVFKARRKLRRLLAPHWRNRTPKP
jgi:RNA polymerase sigma-70 factor (ECF subfamily)